MRVPVIVEVCEADCERVDDCDFVWVIEADCERDCEGVPDKEPELEGVGRGVPLDDAEAVIDMDRDCDSLGLDDILGVTAALSVCVPEGVDVMLRLPTCDTLCETEGVSD